MSRGPLFPRLCSPDDGEALRVGGDALSYRELAAAAAAVADRVAGRTRVAVWAEPSLETAVAAVGSLAAGVTVVPVNPGSGARADELASHVAALLAGHKRPRELHFVDALPRNAMGKVMKRALAPEEE